ncbi:ATPase [Vibrio sp. CAU 1672]|uniref:ATPase n=1 Tax=Vibrio sp. CAU 1672 TaxID=3032594 RepID=UPI0023D9C907|nr:ATPase [Vibrio sp. CAU 1672]MDF2152845.1 ATPase [Vibrio sp. CAU 1672]
MKKFKTAAVAGIIVSALAGCQSTEKDQSAVTDLTNNQSVETQVDAFSLFEKIKTQQDEWSAKLADLDSFKLYSASKVRDLQDSWEETTEVYNDIAEDPSEATEDYSLFSSTTYAEKYSELLGETETLYNQLVALKVQADELLAESIAQMDYLDMLKAKTIFSTTYGQVRSSYLQLFKYVDRNEISDAQFAQVKFLDVAKQLEIKVILKEYVDPLKARLAELRTMKHDSRAPQTYKKAQAEVAKVELTVKTDSRNFAAIEQAVKAAEFRLAHTVSVAHEVTRLSSVKSKRFEPIVLAYEKSLLKISQMVNGTDYRDKPLPQQAASILASLQTSKKQESRQNDELAQELASAKDELSALTVNLEEAVAKLELNQKALQQEKEHSQRLSKLLESYTKTVENAITSNSATEMPTLEDVTEKVEALVSAATE